jgi:hypothetical protein
LERVTYPDQPIDPGLLDEIQVVDPSQRLDTFEKAPDGLLEPSQLSGLFYPHP